jgi:hypothetical protein
MAINPEACLGRLRVIYRDAFKCPPASDAIVIAWATRPELWAEHQIRFYGWSFHAAEAVVRNCRSLVKRAALAAAPSDLAADPFDPLMPTADSAQPDPSACGCPLPGGS